MKEGLIRIFWTKSLFCWGTFPSTIIQTFISSITASCLVSCYCQLQSTCRYDPSLIPTSLHGENKGPRSRSPCPTTGLSPVDSRSTCRGRCSLQSCSIWSTSTCTWLRPTASTCWGVTASHRPTEVRHAGRDTFQSSTSGRDSLSNADGSVSWSSFSPRRLLALGSIVTSVCALSFGPFIAMVRRL